MKTFGLIGYPLGHSFSAAFFNEKFSREGINAVYTNFPMQSVSELRTLITTRPDLCGLNVTIPHKQNVIPLLDALSPMAQRVGAVNVIAIKHSQAMPDGIFLKGYNTDVIGFTESLRPLLKPCHTSALVLGTGGAARAVIAALENLKLSAQCVSRHAQTDFCGAPVCTWDSLTADDVASHTVIINCTPLGMSPHTDSMPPIPFEPLTSSHIVFDLIYNPEETCLLRHARQQGATTQNGLQMLHLQALAAWDIWNSHD